jgi:hypothetical protein
MLEKASHKTPQKQCHFLTAAIINIEANKYGSVDIVA